MRLQHPIFRGPLAFTPTLQPSGDPDYPGNTWLVHGGVFGAGDGVDVGMVSTGWGFEDSPDCEVISGGINSKGPDAVAIGRQANLLSWGFYGAPDRMTSEARAAFLNALVYMQGFDGHRPLVKRVARGREVLTAILTYLDEFEVGSDNYESMVDYVREQFPPGATKGEGLDQKHLFGWYEANLEALRYDVDARRFVVDADLEELGCSNRELELFEGLASTFEEHPGSELALRVLKRYAPASAPTDARGLREWVEANRAALFFTDVGGYRWMLDPRKVHTSPSGAGVKK